MLIQWLGPRNGYIDHDDLEKGFRLKYKTKPEHRMAGADYLVEFGKGRFIKTDDWDFLCGTCPDPKSVLDRVLAWVHDGIPLRLEQPQSGLTLEAIREWTEGIVRSRLAELQAAGVNPDVVMQKVESMASELVAPKETVSEVVAETPVAPNNADLPVEPKQDPAEKRKLWQDRARELKLQGYNVPAFPARGTPAPWYKQVEKLWNQNEKLKTLPVETKGLPVES